MFIGAVVAVAAGAAFAAAGVLQQSVAANTPRPALSVRLLASLGRQPLWLAGIGLAAAGNGLQALALSFAPMALVQPLLVSELLFAIPLSARLYRCPLGRREWVGVVTVSAGVAGTVWGASPRGTADTGSPVRWGLVGGGLVLAAVVLAVIGQRRRSVARASFFAAAAALVFALYSTLLAATVHEFVALGFGALSTPFPYVMTAVSLTGLVLIQSAFQAGPLAVTMPILDWLQPLVAVILAVFVLGEALHTGTIHLLSLGAGAVIALVGILVLDTSPQVRALEQARKPEIRQTRKIPLAAPVEGGTAGNACACRAARRGYRTPDRIRALVAEAAR